MGLTAFNLRQYDARLGRWQTPDPYGQHHSPYLAMSNNPVSFTDPDGGYDEECVNSAWNPNHYMLLATFGMGDFADMVLDEVLENGWMLFAGIQEADGLGGLSDGDELADIYWGNGSGNPISVWQRPTYQPDYGYYASLANNNRSFDTNSSVGRAMEGARQKHPGSIAVGDMKHQSRNDYMDPFGKLLLAGMCAPLAGEFLLPAMVAESAPAMGGAAVTRFGVDATLQTAGNYAAHPERGLVDAVREVNWIQSTVSGAGVFNVPGTAAVGSAFNLSSNEQFQTVFTGHFTVDECATRFALGTGFGLMGKGASSLISRQDQIGLSLGVALNSALRVSPAFGQLAGRATFLGLTEAVPQLGTVPESYINARRK